MASNLGHCRMSSSSGDTGIVLFLLTLVRSDLDWSAASLRLFAAMQPLDWHQSCAMLLEYSVTLRYLSLVL